MAFWNRSRGKELRAEEMDTGDHLLQVLLGKSSAVTREMALQVPTISGGIGLIADIIAGTPIRLYRDEGGRRAKPVIDDPRLRLLNDETGDTLNANEFWHAIVRDYYLGKGGYAYIHKEGGEVRSLHYVEEHRVAVYKNEDPIFKDAQINVNGTIYEPFRFLRVLRNTVDGVQGVSILAENAKLIEAAYTMLLFERNLALSGGRKKGFLTANKRIDPEGIEKLHEAFARLYSNSSENFVVLNEGIAFKEASSTAAELQMNENKRTNAQEFCKLFHVSVECLGGSASAQDVSGLARLAAIPLMTAIQCALNRDLLLESEKGALYFAFDTKELLKGDMAERFSAYKTALDGNFMQIDEVRYAEDLEPLGLQWIRLGLQDVLYDPKTKEIFTPNTGATKRLGEGEPVAEKAPEVPLRDAPGRGTIEERGNQARDANGRFKYTGGRKLKSGTKYAPSKRRNKGGVTLRPKEYSSMCGVFGTKYPGLKPEDGPRLINSSTHSYRVSADGYGGMIVHSKMKIGDKG